MSHNYSLSVAIVRPMPLIEGRLKSKQQQARIAVDNAL